MAYDHQLAARVRAALARKRGVSEKAMFGGFVFFLNGNMLVGVWRDALIVRLGPAAAAAALHESCVGEFNVTGKAMKNWVLVEPAGLRDDLELADWIRRATAFVRTLPGK